MKKDRRDQEFAQVREELGRRIRRERKDRRYSQEQIAKSLEVTQPRVSEWEQGKSFPSIPQVLRFCERHGVGLEKLFIGLARFDFGQLELDGLEPDDREALTRIAHKLRIRR